MEFRLSEGSSANRFATATIRFTNKSDKPLTLVGVAFDVEAKNVREWKAEEG